MKTLALVMCGLIVCTGAASAQITQITAANLISPIVMDFDTAAPAAGPILPTDAYFTSFGLCDVNIINAPGMHNAAGDTLSSGFIGNCLASVNNGLAIVAPGGQMDNHTAGAGWSFRLAPGTTATQFGCIVVDQTNHMMAVETWTGGVLQNTFTFTMSGGFPNPYIYFEDLAGFDEVRFQNTTTAGGWGVDDFTLGNVTGTPTGGTCPPFPPPPYQINSTAASLTVSGLPDPGGFAPIVKSAAINTPETLDLATSNVGAPFDFAISVGNTTVPSQIITPGNQVVNLVLVAPGLTFFNGGAVPDLTTTSFPAPTLSLPFAISTPMIAATQMIVADPLSIDGFALSHAAEYSAETCNANQGFESTPTGIGNAPVGWTNGAAGNAWTIHTGGTGSVGTGPTSAFAGVNYAYCETSIANPATFTLDTCLLDLTTIPGVTGTLNFALSRIGATIGTLELFVDDGTGGGFIPITDITTGMPVTYVGADPGQAQGGTEWSSESVPFLHNIASSSITIRFRYTSSTSFTGDCAIDEVNVN